MMGKQEKIKRGGRGKTSAGGDGLVASRFYSYEQRKRKVLQTNSSIHDPHFPRMVVENEDKMYMCVYVKKEWYSSSSNQIEVVIWKGSFCS